MVEVGNKMAGGKGLTNLLSKGKHVSVVMNRDISLIDALRNKVVLYIVGVAKQIHTTKLRAERRRRLEETL